ncbi:MAG TPA: cytochrome c peroxidase [Minicystis sp.]|nr:cytochrome c peroxidase [Minicystis sp.]
MRRAAFVAAMACLVAACGGAPERAGGGGAGGGAGSGGSGGASYDGPPIPWTYAPFPALEVPSDDPTTDAKVRLGSLLFYDPILSSDDQVACSTCHSENWGMGDGLPLSVGVEGTGPVGPGRTGPNLTTRNALTLWNAAYRTALFWDGRAPTLELQALQPMKHANEMDQPASAGAARVAKVVGYAKLFAQAFPGEAEPVTAKNVTRALASFERTLVTNHAPYDQYVAGDAGAMAPEEKRGMQAFADGGCASCHVPPLFSSDAYFKRFESADPGRSSVTGDPADEGAFRVPTLRNLRDTGPYFHDGSVVDLERAIRDELDRDVARGHAPEMSEARTRDLVAFVYSALVDRSHDPTRPKHVPSGLPVPVDGDRIQR